MGRKITCTVGILQELPRHPPKAVSCEVRVEFTSEGDVRGSLIRGSPAASPGCVSKAFPLWRGVLAPPSSQENRPAGARSSSGASVLLLEDGSGCLLSARSPSEGGEMNPCVYSCYV